MKLDWHCVWCIQNAQNLGAVIVVMISFHIRIQNLPLVEVYDSKQIISSPQVSLFPSVQWGL